MSDWRKWLIVAVAIVAVVWAISWGLASCAKSCAQSGGFFDSDQGVCHAAGDGR